MDARHLNLPRLTPIMQLHAKTKCILCCGVVTLVIVIFFLSIFSSCYSTPVSVLYQDGDDLSTILPKLHSKVHTVRILNYNMFLRSNPITDSGTKNDWKNERLALFINTELDKFDILLLQEVWTPFSEGRKDQLIAAAKEMGFLYYVRSGCKGKLIDAMLLILSRHPIMSAEEFTYTNFVGDETHASKGALGATIHLYGQQRCRTDVFTTHLQAGESSNGGNEVRRSQTRELGAFVKSRTEGSSNPLMAIIGGDFNINGRTSKRNGTPSGFYVSLEEDLQHGLKPSIETSTNRSLINMILPPWRQMNRKEADEWNVTDALPVTSPVRTLGSETSKLIGFDDSKGSALDYIFVAMDEGSGGGGGGVQPVKNRSIINAYRVRDQPFIALSDHFGVEVAVVCSVE